MLTWGDCYYFVIISWAALCWQSAKTLRQDNLLKLSIENNLMCWSSFSPWAKAFLTVDTDIYRGQLSSSCFWLSIFTSCEEPEGGVCEAESSAETTVELIFYTRVMLLCYKWRTGAVKGDKRRDLTGYTSNMLPFFLPKPQLVCRKSRASLSRPHHQAVICIKPKRKRVSVQVV